MCQDIFFIIFAHSHLYNSQHKQVALHVPIEKCSSQHFNLFLLSFEENKTWYVNFPL